MHSWGCSFVMTWGTSLRSLNLNPGWGLGLGLFHSSPYSWTSRYLGKYSSPGRLQKVQEAEPSCTSTFKSSAWVTAAHISLIKQTNKKQVSWPSPKSTGQGCSLYLFHWEALQSFIAKNMENNSVIGRKRKNGNNKLEKRIGLGAGKS